MAGAEYWRPVPVREAEHLFEVSSRGAVRRIDNGNHLKGWVDHLGYRRVSLSCGSRGSVITAFVHKLVIRAFSSDGQPGWHCRHLNGDPGDNRIENLVWGTCKQNKADSMRHGTHARGDSHGKSKLNSESVKVIRHTLSKDRSAKDLLARLHCVDESTIRKAHTGRYWREEQSG